MLWMKQADEDRYPLGVGEFGEDDREVLAAKEIEERTDLRDDVPCGRHFHGLALVEEGPLHVDDDQRAAPGLELQRRFKSLRAVHGDRRSASNHLLSPRLAFGCASNDRLSTRLAFGCASNDRLSPRLAFGCASNDRLSPRLAFGCASNDRLSPRLAFGCASNYHAATENAFGMCRIALTPPSSLTTTATTSKRQGCSRRRLSLR